MEYNSASRKKEILPFATTWRSLEGIMPSEMSQTEKDKYNVVPLLRGISKKKSDTGTESRKVVSRD